jgi:Uma2 family endonuclease
MIEKTRIDLNKILSSVGDLLPEERDALIRELGGDDLPAGIVIAHGVSLDDYMEHYAGEHCEWIEGYVIKMPGELKHNEILYHLYTFILTYLSLRPIGRIVGQPFVMYLSAFPRRRRLPDILIILATNPHELKPTFMDGPADICIEIVSEESVKRDYEEKFTEYEIGGVGEYWIIDSKKQETRFYVRDEDGKYTLKSLDTQENYTTPLLPGLKLHIPTLWQEQLPGPVAIVQNITQMLDK